jgi:hypothetical protein
VWYLAALVLYRDVRWKKCDLWHNINCAVVA